MTHNKRKKNSRQRGSWTHGWGAKKKHRGAGHRGGRGKAGTGKKGDAKKTMYWHEVYFGKKGFVSITEKKVNTINLSQLESLGKESKINLQEKGYNKLLGAGKITKKIEVTVLSASEKAIQKIEAAGGKVHILKQEKQKKDDKKE